MGNQPDAIRGVVAVVCETIPDQEQGNDDGGYQVAHWDTHPPSISRQAQIAPPVSLQIIRKLYYIHRFFNKPCLAICRSGDNSAANKKPRPTFQQAGFGTEGAEVRWFSQGELK
jgi:hypothetical protein